MRCARTAVTVTVLAAGLVVLVPVAVTVGVVERQLRRWCPSTPPSLEAVVEASRRAAVIRANIAALDAQLGFTS